MDEPEWDNDLEEVISNNDSDAQERSLELPFPKELLPRRIKTVKHACVPGTCCLTSQILRKERDLVTRPQSPWMLFVKENRFANELYKVAQVRLSPAWRALTEERRKKYDVLFLQEKERYRRDIQNLDLDQQDILKQYQKRKKQERKQIPKMSGYMMFVKEQWTRARLSLDEHATNKDCVTFLALEWKGLSQPEKDLYQTKASQYKQIIQNKKSKKNEH